MHLWMRHESRTTERRAPLTPSDARAVVESGHRLTVDKAVAAAVDVHRALRAHTHE